ncbi:Transcription factor iws1 [Savitreella phatthalungensis]
MMATRDKTVSTDAPSTDVAAGEADRVSPDGERAGTTDAARLGGAGAEAGADEIRDAQVDMEPEEDPLAAEDPAASTEEGLTEDQAEELQQDAPRSAEDVSNQPRPAEASNVDEAAVSDGDDDGKGDEITGEADKTGPSVTSAAVDNMFDSDDELSDLDEEQFKDMDAAGIDASQPAIYNLPSFKKRSGAKASERRKAAKPARRQKGSGPAPARGDAAGGDSDSEDGKIYSDDEKPRKKASARSLPPPKPTDPEEAAKWEVDRIVERAIAPARKRTKLDGDALEAKMDDEIVNVTDRMRVAAQADAEANASRKVATAKLRMLPEVKAVLTSQQLSESILENGMLTSVKYWLEPLPDHSLPSLDIQRALFAALDQLPIKTEHLRESGVGKVVLFYKKSRRPEHEIKMLADRLILRWSRPIIKKSHDYRTRRVELRDVSRQPGTGAGAMLGRSLASRAPEPVATSLYRSKGGTVIPRGESTYDVAPRARDLLAASNSLRMAGASRDDAPDAYRNLKRTLKGMSSRAGAGGSSTKKGGVSIEGRGIA